MQVQFDQKHLYDIFYQEYITHLDVEGSSELKESKSIGRMNTSGALLMVTKTNLEEVRFHLFPSKDINDDRLYVHSQSPSAHMDAATARTQIKSCNRPSESRYAQK